MQGLVEADATATYEMLNFWIGEFTGDADMLVQYVGMETGVFRRHPEGQASNTCDEDDRCYPSCSGGCASSAPGCSGDCVEYDPRIRPWYTLVISEPIDVIIAVDISSSMDTQDVACALGTDCVTRWTRAKDAVETVLGTLSTEARVGLLFFNDEPLSMTGDTAEGVEIDSCFATQLFDASSVNVNLAIDHIQNRTRSGLSDYERAIDAAVELVEVTSDSRNTAIVFISDGTPETGLIGDNLISYMNDRLQDGRDHLNATGSELAFFSYSVGDSVAFELTEVGGEPVNNGEHVTVSSETDLRTAMGNYFRKFTPTGEPEIKWTEPYCDAFGAGIITTPALRVEDSQGNLIGVAATDIPLAELFAEVSAFGSADTYGILIDGEGKALIHPLLSPPADVNRPPIFQDIITLEKHADFVSIRQDMIDGNEGDVTVNSLRVLARGDTTEGARSVEVSTRYVYRKITGTEFSLALAQVTDSATTNSLLDPGAPTERNATNHYHSLGAYSAGTGATRKPKTDLTHPLLVTTEDHSTYKFAPKGFVQPYEYIYAQETPTTVQGLNAIVNGITDSEFELDDESPFIPLDDVVWEARLTQAIEPSWRDTLEDWPQIIWRYIGTNLGTFRTYPGTNAGKTYDPNRRPWYGRAITAAPNIAVSAPYNDASGAGQVITLSKAIFEAGADRVTDGKTVGVAAMDLLYGSFYALVSDASRESDAADGGCPVPGAEDPDRVCFLVDDSLLAIMAADFLPPVDDEGVISMDKDEFPDPEVYENKFFGEVEPGFASDFITANYWQMSQCNNYQKSVTTSFYVADPANLDPEGVTGTSSDLTCAEGDFHIRAINGTNLYLVVVDNYDSTSNRPESCECQQECAALGLNGPSSHDCALPGDCPFATDCDAAGQVLVSTPTDIANTISTLPVSCPVIFDLLIEEDLTLDIAWLLFISMGILAVAGVIYLVLRKKRGNDLKKLIAGSYKGKAAMTSDERKALKAGTGVTPATVDIAHSPRPPPGSSAPPARAQQHGPSLGPPANLDAARRPVPESAKGSPYPAAPVPQPQWNQPYQGAWGPQGRPQQQGGYYPQQQQQQHRGGYGGRGGYPAQGGGRGGYPAQGGGYPAGPQQNPQQQRYGFGQQQRGRGGWGAYGRTANNQQRGGWGR